MHLTMLAQSLEQASLASVITHKLFPPETYQSKRSQSELRLSQSLFNRCTTESLLSIPTNHFYALDKSLDRTSVIVLL